MKKNQCTNCHKAFTIKSEDIEFYKKIQVPEPTHCPDCRIQRRLVLRNELSLYEDKCDLCNKNIISLYSEDKPYTIYCYDCFYSDKWDPMKYGQDYDFNKPFFEQFKELQQKVPRIFGFNIRNGTKFITLRSVIETNEGVPFTAKIDAKLELNPKAPPVDSGGNGGSGGNGAKTGGLLPWVFVTAAGAALISENRIKKRRRK